MDNLNGDKSIDEINKRIILKKSEESSNPTKKKNSSTNPGDKRRNISNKSPPNPFMSRLNISSFLDLMMSDKNDTGYNAKNRKNVTSNNFSMYVNTVKSQKDNSQSSNNQIPIHSEGISTSNATHVFNTSLKTCPVCANELPDLLVDNYTNCSHSACIDCWQSYVINRIESYEIGYGFTCLTCTSELPYHHVVDIIKLTSDADYSKKLLLRLETFYLDRALLQDTSIRWCPNPGCQFGFSLIPDFIECPKLSKCQLRPMCNGHLCNNHCIDFWKNIGVHDCVHQSKPTKSNGQSGSQCCLSKDARQNSRSDLDNTISHNSNLPTVDELNKSDHPRNFWLRCFPWRRARHRKETKDYKSKRKIGRGDDNSFPKTPNQIEVEEIASLASIKTSSSRTKFQHSNDQIQTEGEVKTCPKCHTYVLKMNDGSCNHMVCVVCGCEFCWLCMRQITDMHYLSPSGCTFWGRRQWNVEKRALWQLGTLIGAPVAIGFLAALAIPAMVIGIPLYVGRKIHGALKTKNKDRKRTIALAGGIGAFIVSPVIAAVAVGLGVPLILAYVYVVMPIALCRASACSCDDNIPPQDEVDFSDVTSSQPHEFPENPSLNHSTTGGDIQTAIITGLPYDTDKLMKSHSYSATDIVQTPLHRYRRPESMGAAKRREQEQMHQSSPALASSVGISSQTVPSPQSPSTTDVVAALVSTRRSEPALLCPDYV